MQIRRHEAKGVMSDAVFSRCGGYRYALSREWGAGPRLGFVMLNPSRADERANDPTVKRCQRRAQAWGAGGFSVLNLFAWRATLPADLRAAPDPVGPQNDAVLADYLARADQVICAWGYHGAYRGRAAEVVRALRAQGLALYHMGLTQAGHPRHPLYLPYRATPELWTC